MKKTFIFLFLFQLTIIIGIAERVDRWAPLRYLAGAWKMVKPEGTNTQHYSFLFNGTFMQMKTKAVFKSSKKKPKGEIHEDIGIFSYDGHREKLVLRSFHSEGFVNTYVLGHISKDNKILTFVSESVENAPAGTRAKLTFKKINNREMKQKFFVSWPNKDYNCLSDNHLKKVN